VAQAAQEERAVSVVTKLIELSDGMFVEVDAPHDQVEEISGGAAERVASTFEKVRPALLTMCRSVQSSFEELRGSTTVERAELEVGLSFEAEGNLYITRSKANANLVVRFVFSPGT
jgi:hypothetical protein